MDDTYRILAHGRTVSNDTWQTGLNNNDLIIGPSGSYRQPQRSGSAG